jgi:hypothetical protein
MPSLVKLDAVGFVENNRFTEFSCIYTFETNDKVLNPSKEPNIRENLLYYYYDGNYFKVAKRMFSVCKIEGGHDAELEKLNVILNSDLGLLYSIVNDCKTILYLLENEADLPMKKIDFELDQMRGRLGGINDIQGVNVPSVLKDIMELVSLPSSLLGRRQLAMRLDKIIAFFENHLSKASKDAMLKAGLLPLHKFFAP